jgi:predicted  nucleic acid-binding Zn-ribbon protein
MDTKTENPLDRMQHCPDCGQDFKTGNQSKHGGCPKCNSAAWQTKTEPQPAPDAVTVALADLRSYLYGVAESDQCRARLLGAASTVGKGLAQMELDLTAARAAHAETGKELADLRAELAGLRAEVKIATARLIFLGDTEAGCRDMYRAARQVKA